MRPGLKVKGDGIETRDKEKICELLLEDSEKLGLPMAGYDISLRISRFWYARGSSQEG